MAATMTPSTTELADLEALWDEPLPPIVVLCSTCREWVPVETFQPHDGGHGHGRKMLAPLVAARCFRGREHPFDHVLNVIIGDRVHWKGYPGCCR